MWKVLFLAEADREIAIVSPRERAAILSAVAKLEALGPQLPFPHQSAVKGVVSLRELRPRGGRSPLRAFYRRVGDVFVIAAIGPEALVNPGEFDQKVRSALIRLDDVKE